MPSIVKQVRSNKDASKLRDEDRIAERYQPDLNAVCLLQLLAGNSQIVLVCIAIVCRLFVGYLPPFPLKFCNKKKRCNGRMGRRTEGPTNRPTDGRTDPHIDML